MPKTAPWAARTVFVKVPFTFPAMKGAVCPVLPAGMVPPPLVTDQAGLMATTLPPASLPTAVNVCTAPWPSVTGFGVTVIEASGPGVTMTVAEPESPPAVAVTLLAKVPAVFPAVKSPVPALMVPGGFVVDQAGVIGTTLPPASFPTAVNCCWAPTASVAGFGVTVMLASGPAVTMTVAVPEIAPEVARTPLAKVPVVLPAVKSPVEALMVPGGLVVDQTGVIGTTLPAASLPTAVNCCWAPMASVAGFGVTVIVASGPATTVTVATLDLPPQVTVMVLVPGVEPAVNTPAWVIVPPPETAHPDPLSVVTASPARVPATVNGTVPFTATVAVAGEMVSVVSCWGPLGSPHAAANRPASASAETARAMRPRRACGARALHQVFH